MDEDSKPGWLKWSLGAIGLAAVAGSAAISLWVGVAILLLALLLFGGLFLVRWWLGKRRGGELTRGVGEGSPQAVSQADRKAELDSMLQRFRTGLKEFDRAGYSVYEYPWFVVIGESGAGKTEAMRSALEDQVPNSVKHHIPPRDQGTKDFVWWFTKHGIVLDTAGRMVVGEAGASKDDAWRLFLGSLRKGRPRCPINGLLLALSAESLIKDNGERISEKATQLGQKIEMIQRQLDVRFPVYVLVTKCDLLTGFREFTAGFEDDPQLQHQMFGWSNPGPLDEPFKPELVHDYLLGVVEQVKRRRLALLRPSDRGGKLGDTQFFAQGYQLGQSGTEPNQMDEVDAMFAFPESLMSLEPRLRRYLDTIFVAGPFSPKPVFLRGIYFTSAMREGRALDEAQALITGVPLEELPDDRTWDRNKSFFLRDLFVQKVVPEKGLVTRAKSTRKLLRQQRIAIYGSGTLALLLLVGFAWFGYRKLDQSVRAEARFWGAAAKPENWAQGEWSPQVVTLGPGQGRRFIYNGDAQDTRIPDTLTLAAFEARLRNLAETNLPVPWIFRPISWLSTGARTQEREKAQRAVFVGSVIKPLLSRTREKMGNDTLAVTNRAAVGRHEDALLELVRVEAAGLKHSSMEMTNAEVFFQSLLSYLTEMNTAPDTNLVQVFARTYLEKGSWPGTNLLAGNTLSANAPISQGLSQLNAASTTAAAIAMTGFTNLQNLANGFDDYMTAELIWFPNSRCEELANLGKKIDAIRSQSNALLNSSNLTQCYQKVYDLANTASASPLYLQITNLLVQIPEATRSGSIVKQVGDRLASASRENLTPLEAWYGVKKGTLKSIDVDCLTGAPTAPMFERRWSLYTNACELKNASAHAVPEDIGQKWRRFTDLNQSVSNFQKSLQTYSGPLLVQASNACAAIAGKAVQELKSHYVDSYVRLVTNQLETLRSDSPETSITNARAFFEAVKADINDKQYLEPEDQPKVAVLSARINQAKARLMQATSEQLNQKIDFPLKLKGNPPAKAKPTSDLAKFRHLMDVLTKELEQPEWQHAADDVRKQCDALAPLLNMLVEASGKASEWDLYFVGSNDPKERMISEIIRDVTGTHSDGQNGQKLTEIDHLDLVGEGKTVLLGSLRADEQLQLVFRKNSGDRDISTTLELSDWWLPRLMAERADSSFEHIGSWRFRIRLDDPAQSQTGYATFEARLKSTGTTPFPKFKDWSAGDTQASGRPAQQP
jgi:hypothetical protein